MRKISRLSGCRILEITLHILIIAYLLYLSVTESTFDSSSFSPLSLSLSLSPFLCGDNNVERQFSRFAFELRHRHDANSQTLLIYRFYKK